MDNVRGRGADGHERHGAGVRVHGRVRDDSGISCWVFPVGSGGDEPECGHLWVGDVGAWCVRSVRVQFWFCKCTSFSPPYLLTAEKNADLAAVVF